MKYTFLLLSGIALLFSCTSSSEPEEKTQTDATKEEVIINKPTGFLTSYSNINKERKDHLSKRYVSKTANKNKFEKIKFAPTFTSYDSLEQGEKDQLNQRYVSKNVDWHKYKQVKINPVQLWANSDSNLNKIDQKELQNLLNYIHAQVTQELSDYFDVTELDGPNVLNISIALSDGEASCIALEPSSTPVPLGIASAFVKKSSPKLHQLINNTSIEIKVENIKTPELFFAGIDSITNEETNWIRTKENFDSWAIRFKKELLVCGAGK
jgi:hypothetical protein